MRIPGRFSGPPGSAHGGYTCGTVAAVLGDGRGPARVSLRAPTPVDRELEVVRTDDGIQMRDGDRLVAEGVLAELDLDPTDAVDPERAAEASQAGYERWAAEHPFPGCFACGPARARRDGLRLFPGPLGDGRFATAWTPDVTLADHDETVRPEYVWAALDCPTSAPVADFGGTVAVLAQLHGQVDRPVTVGAPHAVVAWSLGIEGRKRHSACAIFDAEGETLAWSQALWIALRR